MPCFVQHFSLIQDAKLPLAGSVSTKKKLSVGGEVSYSIILCFNPNYTYEEYCSSI